MPWLGQNSDHASSIVMLAQGVVPPVLSDLGFRAQRKIEDVVSGHRLVIRPPSTTRRLLFARTPTPRKTEVSGNDARPVLDPLLSVIQALDDPGLFLYQRVLRARIWHGRGFERESADATLAKELDEDEECLL